MEKDTQILEQPQSKFTLRKVEADDIFVVTTLLGQIGFKEIKRIAKDSDLMALLKDKEIDGLTKGIGIGAEIVEIILTHIEVCKNQVYRFLSRLSGLEIETIAKLPPADFVDMIYEVVEQDEFVDFFKAASRFFK